MRKSLVCLAIVFVISFTCVGYSQETLTSQPDLPAARNVIEKYIEALGGELQLTSLNSFRFKARIIDDNDLWWKSEEYVQAGSNWMAHFRGPAFDFQSGVHDYRVWHHNLNNDKAWWHNSSWSIEGLNRAFDKPLGWLGQLQAIEVAGKEAIDGRDAWRLEFIIGRYFSEQSQGKTIRWFDTETGLMVKRETPFSDSRYLITQRFFDYRDVGGARFPFRVDNSLAGKDKQWTTEVVEFESLEESGKPVSWRPDSLKPIEDGLVARGIVVDSENGSPIVGCKCSHLPESSAKKLQSFNRHEFEGRVSILSTRIQKYGRRIRIHHRNTCFYRPVDQDRIGQNRCRWFGNTVANRGRKGIPDPWASFGRGNGTRRTSRPSKQDG